MVHLNKVTLKMEQWHHLWPSWFKKRAQRCGRDWILISLVGHNNVDSSPERLWHLAKHYKLFCNIYKKKKMTDICVFFVGFNVSGHLTHSPGQNEKKKKMITKGKKKTKRKQAHGTPLKLFDSQNVWQCKRTSISQIIYKHQYTLQHHCLLLLLNTYQ